MNDYRHEKLDYTRARLKDFMNFNKVSINRFAVQSGIPLGTINNLLYNNTNVSKPNLVKINTAIWDFPLT